MQHDVVSYEADSQAFRSHLYVPDGGGPRPGVLVFPEGPGLSDLTKTKAKRLAEAGYVALACDLWGDERILERPAMMDELMALIQDVGRTRTRARAAWEALSARPEVDGARIAAIGFCFGGTMSLQLAMSGAPIKAAVGFHSGLPSAEDAGKITGKVLLLLGADDPGIKPDARLKFEEEMRAGGVDWRMHLYGGVLHSYTNPDADKLGQPEFLRYDAGADKRSWAEMLALFEEVF